MTYEESAVLEWLKLDIIHRSEGHKIVGSDRRLRFVIASLQAQGYPIVSLTKGYKLGTPEEVQAYCAREKHRAATIFRKIRALDKQADDILKQMELL